MRNWIRDNTSRLTRVEMDNQNNQNAQVQNNQNALVQNNPIMLQDRCYPIRSSLPTCIRLPVVNGNNFEIKPHYINMLPKFAGQESEDAYVFISEFEEVCSMMKLQQLSDDAIKLRFVPFALKENAKNGCIAFPQTRSHLGKNLPKPF